MSNSALVSQLCVFSNAADKQNKFRLICNLIEIQIQTEHSANVVSMIDMRFKPPTGNVFLGRSKCYKLTDVSSL